MRRVDQFLWVRSHLRVHIGCGPSIKHNGVLLGEYAAPISCLASHPWIRIMMLFRSGLTTALAAFSLLGSSLAAPLVDKLKSLSPGARDLLKRSTPAAPRFVVYSDAWVNPLPTPEDLKVSRHSRILPLANTPLIQGYNI